MYKVSDIKKAVAAKLNQTFGLEYEINTEEVFQNMKPPSFFIKGFMSAINQLVGRRYDKRNTIIVNFFPIKNDSTEVEQCTNVAEQLWDILEYIEWEGIKARGTNMSYQIIDKILVFQVDYNFTVLKPIEAQEKMEVLEEETFLKEE